MDAEERRGDPPKHGENGPNDLQCTLSTPMSQVIGHVEQHCIFCGNAYRVPRWGRAYTCGACGQPLRGAPQRARRTFAVPAWLFYAGGAVALTAMLVWLVTTRQAEQRGGRRDLQASPGFLQQLPPHQEERIRQRLALLEEDRQKDSRDPVLLVLQAESYLQLGVLHQKSDPKKAADELQHCQRLAAELAKTHPDLNSVAGNLVQQAQAPAALGWVVSGSASNTTRWPPIEDDAATGLMGDTAPHMAMPEFPAKMELRGDRERRDARTDPAVMTPGSSFPRMGHPPVNAPSAFAPAGPPMNGPRGFFGIRPMPYEMPPGSPAGQSLQELRVRVATYPEDTRAAEALGELLEMRAQQYALGVYAGRPSAPTLADRSLAEALHVYSVSAAHVRTRLRRAQMLVAEAGVHRKLGEGDEELRLLRQAASEAPYAPVVWRQIQNALLYKGDFGKAREAWKQYQDWLLPRTRDRRP